MKLSRLIVCGLAVCFYLSTAGCFAVSRPDDRSYEDEESDDHEEETSSTETTVEPSEKVSETTQQIYVISDEDKYAVASDIIAFLFDSEQYYSCDADGNGTEDHILLSDEGEVGIICSSSSSGVNACLYEAMSEWGHLYYSSGLNKVLVSRGRAVPTYTWDEYLIFDGTALRQDSFMKWVFYDWDNDEELYDPIEEYIVNDVSVSESAYDSHIESYGELSELVSSGKVSSRQTEIPSDQIPVLRDEIMRIMGDPYARTYDMDFNGDGITDSLINLFFFSGALEGIQISTEEEEEISLWFKNRCTVIMLSSDSGIEVCYLDPDDSTEFLNNLQDQ